MGESKLTPNAIAELRGRAAELAPAGRQAFPAICGVMSSGDSGPEPCGLYSEETTLRCVRGVFLRMLDAIEGIEVYQPSNGTEGEIFMRQWCMRCAKDNFDEGTGEGGCNIIVMSMAFDPNDAEYPRAWRVGVDGRPMCAEFAPKPEGDA